MSQQDNSQANQDVPPVPSSGSWSTEPASNRPADGATRVASLHQAEQTWRAGEGATDFLGLEQDAAAETPAATAAAGAEPSAPEVNPTQAWLFHMENEAQAGAAMTAEPTPEQLAATAAPEWSAEALLAGQDTSTPLETEFAAKDLAPQPSPEFEEQPTPELVGETPAVEPRRSRKVQWLVAAGLVACLAAAGGWQVWHGKAKDDNPASSDPMAWRSGSKKPKPGSKPSDETPPIAQTSKPTGKPNPEPKLPPVSEPVPTPEVAQSEPPATEPTSAQNPAPPGAQPASEPAPTTAAVPAPVAPQPETQPATPAAAVDLNPVAFSGLRPAELAANIATPKGARRPDAAEVADLWIDEGIPFDAIAGSQIVRTPRVGAVRLMLKNGEHLQGRLHAVGQGQVSVDIALGRMAVDYSDISEMVQIREADLNKKPSNGLPEETSGLMYVSAKVPGGYLCGWLVQRADGKLTLITEEAKKITVDDDGFEPISKGRARVVGTIGRDASGEMPATPPRSDTGIPKLKSGTDASKSSASKTKPAAPKPAPKAPAKPKD